MTDMEQDSHYLSFHASFRCHVIVLCNAYYFMYRPIIAHVFSCFKVKHKTRHFMCPVLATRYLTFSYA